MAAQQTQSGIEVVIKTTAFKKRIKTYTLKNLEYIDLLPFFEEAERLFIEKTQKVLRTMHSVKSNLLLEAKFTRPCGGGIIAENTTKEKEVNENKEEESQIITFYLQSKMKAISLTTDLSQWFRTNVVDVMLAKVDQLQEYGSGWTLHEIVQLDVNFNKYVQFSGTSYLPLPRSIKNKHAIINVKNNDNQCFKWAVLSALHPAVDHSDRISKYERFKNELNFNNINFPVSLKDISSFEQQNPDISIHVYIIQKEYDINKEMYKKMILPIRLTKQVKKNHIHLLLIFKTDMNEEDDNDDNVCNININSDYINKVLHDELTHTHYAWIKNLSAMIQGQVVQKLRVKRYICDRCLHYFYLQESLYKHIEQCEKLNECKITLPYRENRWLSFKNYKSKIQVPFIIYADIESFQVPISNNDDYENEEANITSKPPKDAIQRHIPYSIGYYFHSRNDPSLSHYKSYFGSDCIPNFINRLKELMIDIVWDTLHKKNPMVLTEQESEEFEKSTVCHICNKPFVISTPSTSSNTKKTKRDINADKVHDHCHITGKYRGAAHSKCNLAFQISKDIPIVFHNLNYDSHFFIEHLANMFPGHMTIIPKTSENYISFSKEMCKSNFIKTNKQQENNAEKYREKLNLRFIDSFKFLQCSLAKLAKNLPADKLHITHKEWSCLSDSDFQLLTQKGIYPYSYVNSWDRLKETKLPSQKNFYDELNDCKITNEEYKFAQKVWKTFKIKSMRAYTELYLKTDVLLLADIFENFRDSCIKLYELDPAHYYTLPGYSWDCMLKYTKVEIELFTDIDKLLFVERGLRGGISQCSNRYSKANNQYMGTDFDVNKPVQYLMYFDVNNLYGWAMTQPLPISDYIWINIENFKDIEKFHKYVTSLSDTAPFGYLFEVDIEYPQNLHNLHNDYPFCCEHLKMGNSNETKLVCTLYDKQNYIIHYRMLKLAINHGLKVKKIHNIMRFKQSTWLNEYIMLNTRERTNSKTAFEKDLYKLMNNAIFGKSMENVRKRVDIKLINKWDGRYGMKEQVAKPNFKRCVIFNSDLVACELERLNVIIKKPIIVGNAILEISKTLMYSFHYDFMLKEFSYKDCQIQYTDTDSFMYRTNENIYTFLRKNHEKFDTSNYPIINPYGIKQQNEKMLGLMKDENSGKIVKEFIGLRSKMYTFKIQAKKGKIIKKAKGVKKSVLDKKISFKDYKRCIDESCTLEKNQSSFRSHLHKMYTVSNSKKVLDPFDDKRYIIPNTNETLAWGHYKIKK